WSPFKKVSGVASAATASTQSLVRYNGSFGSRQFSEVTITSTLPEDWGTAVRIQGTAAGQGSCYLGVFRGSMGVVQLYSVSDTGTLAFPSLTTFGGITFAVNDRFRLTADRNVLYVSQNDVIKGAFLDTTLTGGQPGIWGYGSAGAANEV